MSKLWEKNYTIDKTLEEFTVGEDYILDRNLVPADCAASIAHAVMLQKIGILTLPELDALKQGLREIIGLNAKGEFTVKREDEDCHTAIENHLVAKLGDAGKKVHTGRSRNDQIIAALKLYARDFILELTCNSLELVDAFFTFAEANKEIPMPGRTHMQVAMPSSVGLWAAAFGEALLDDLKLLLTAYDFTNSCPLGSAASYGVPLPLDRELTAQLLGFNRVQNNVLYVNNSRGKFESVILDAAEQIVITLSKFAQDLILFTLPEFKYFSLPDELCTGSSIMPQKKNPDGLELLRGKSATISGYAAQVKNIIRALPSGYNRDFQETKAPFMKGAALAIGCVRIATQAVQNLKVHKENLIKAFTPEIFATDYAIELVNQGMAFRDAYKQVGTNLQQLTNRDPVAALKTKCYTGTTGNLNLPPMRAEKERLEQLNNSEKAKISAAMENLTGIKMSLF